MADTTPTDGPDDEATGFRAAFAHEEESDDTEGHVRVTPTLPTQADAQNDADEDDVEGHQKLVP